MSLSLVQIIANMGTCAKVSDSAPFVVGTVPFLKEGASADDAVQYPVGPATTFPAQAYPAPATANPYSTTSPAADPNFSVYPASPPYPGPYGTPVTGAPSAPLPPDGFIPIGDLSLENPGVAAPGMPPPMGAQGMPPPMGAQGMPPPMGSQGMPPPMGAPGMPPPMGGSGFTAPYPLANPYSAATNEPPPLVPGQPILVGQPLPLNNPYPVLRK